MEGRTEGRTEGWKAEIYVPPLFFEKAGDNNSLLASSMRVPQLMPEKRLSSKCGKSDKI